MHRVKSEADTASSGQAISDFFEITDIVQKVFDIINTFNKLWVPAVAGYSPGSRERERRTHRNLSLVLPAREEGRCHSEF